MGIVWLLAAIGAGVAVRVLRKEWRSWREAARWAEKQAKREAERRERLRWN